MEMTDAKTKNAIASIRTGGVRPLRIDGKVAVEITDVGENAYTSRYVASVYGWRRHYTTGQGPTPEAALRDWCDNTGNDFGQVVRECHLMDGDGQPIDL
jgi:hypothetical protein